MPNHRTTPAAHELWRRTQIALAKVSGYGCRIDKAYLDGAITKVTSDIKALEAAMIEDPDFRFWRRRYGEKSNLTSYSQLAEVAYKDLCLTAKKKTDGGGRDSAARSNFEGVQIPIIRKFVEASELRKALDTYLIGIRREVIQHADGLWYVHPSYNLNAVISQRSSSSDPNYQNIPNRNPLIAEIIRRCYIPRPGRQLGEIDYGQIEVRIPCPYTFDPVLMNYVCDPSTDMHRDVACQIFKLTIDQVKQCKPLRNLVKGAYVFATFYGSYWGLTAKALWEGIDAPNMKFADGTTVREHLTKIGFTDLGLECLECLEAGEGPAKGTWAHWIKSVDEEFWGERFKVYAQWKKDWYEAYLRTGGFTMLTGFAVNFPLDKKSVTNAPIQGVAFHCLAWSLCQMIEWLEKYRMSTCVIGQIHDCLTMDLESSEVDDVFWAARDIMTCRIKKWAPWLNVPLVVEPELCGVDRSWYEKKSTTFVER